MILVLCLSSAAFAVGPKIKSEKINGKERKFEADHLIVKFKEGTSEAEEDALLKKHKSDKAQSFKGIDKMHKVKVPPGQEKKLKAELEASEKVEFVELNEVVPGDRTTNDPQAGWHLDNIQAPAAWDISTGPNPTVVAILDTGVDVNHPDLSGRTVPGYNFIDNNTNVADVQGHGTAVAGSAVVATNNGQGLASQCWGCKIMPVRIAYMQDGGAWAMYSTIVSGMQWAANNGAKIINCSYGGIYNSSAIASAANYVKSKGGLVFISMGNENAYVGSAVASDIIYVGATANGNTKAWFSNYGPIVSLSAPGQDILTTNNGGSYGWWNGTSFASPMAAGTAALLWSAKPSLTLSQVRNAILTGVDDLGPAGKDNEFGVGKINALKALKIALGSTPTPTPTPKPSPTPTPSPITWTKCADEGQWCNFSGTRDVRYGTDSVFYTKTFTNGVNCTNSVFGDPVYGTVKKCSFGPLK
jgi:subtilisin family serine protease